MAVATMALMTISLEMALLSMSNGHNGPYRLNGLNDFNYCNSYNISRDLVGTLTLMTLIELIAVIAKNGSNGPYGHNGCIDCNGHNGCDECNGYNGFLDN